MTGTGTSGVAKGVSWASLMEVDTGMKIRVVQEASPIKELLFVKDGQMFAASISYTAMTDLLDGREGYASAQLGPFPVRALWVHDLSNAGFFVRGDSSIKTIYDIRPGTRFAVWDLRWSTLRWCRAFLKWVQLDEKDIVWFDAGTTNAAVRAVMDGRADIMFFFPIAPQMYEAAAAPHGIRFLDLNSDKDPEGAKRMMADFPGTTTVFGPITSGPEGAVGHWGTVTYKLMYTREASDPELVYHFVKWLDENYAKYKDTYDTNRYMSIDHVRQAMEGTFIPVHEGLIRYLKEKGLWTEALESRNQANLAALNTRVEAYKGALAEAGKKGITVDPNNEAWLDFWEKYKEEHKVSPVAPIPTPTPTPTAASTR
ncbi:MAG: TAXI family TRAP transporter solute-binding subunit [Chloroflexota bacterium]